MTTPGDESRTELAWREIVEHYGERAQLPTDETLRAGPELESPTGPRADPGAGPEIDSPEPTALPDHLVDEDEISVREAALAESERFRPPAAPPFPVPRTWQRGVAWAGISVAPALALLIGLLDIYVASLVGWGLVLWFVGGFLYLVFDMPSAPREPWDDGSRI